MPWWPQPSLLRSLVRRPLRRAPARAGRGIIPRLERLEAREVPARMIAVGSGLGNGSMVRIYIDKDGDGAVSDTLPGSPAPLFADEFQAYSVDAEVHVAFADIDGDGNDELITAPGKSVDPTLGSKIRIWDISPEGKVLGRIDQFAAFAAPSDGAWIAAADILDIGRDQLIIGAGANLSNGPRVRIYGDIDGDGLVSDDPRVDQFTAYESDFMGGVRVAVGNVDVQGMSDDRLEIITAPGPGRAGEVKIFSDTDGDTLFSDNTPSVEVSEVFPGYFGGLFVAAGNLATSSPNDEIVVSSDQGNPGLLATISIFSDTDGDGAVLDNLVDTFTPYSDSNFTGGIRLGIGNLRDGMQPQLVYGAGPTLSPNTNPGAKVRVLQDVDNDGALNESESRRDNFQAFQNYNGGIFVAVGRTQTGTISATYLPDPATLPSPILDDGMDNRVSRIRVADRAGLIADLNVSINLSHASINTLTASLRHTSLSNVVTTIELFTGLGTGSGLQLIIDDSAMDPLDSNVSGSPVVGVFQPSSDTLATFNGLDAAGRWDLFIQDATVDGVSGNLLDWSLIFRFQR